ncbi:MAG: GGDEF domain-containing protein [Gemmatimonadota bacterium]
MTALRIKGPAAGDVYATVRRVREWQVWTLPALPQAYICGVTALAVGVAIAAGLHAQMRLAHIAVFAALVACGIITIESTRSVKEVHGTLVRDLQAVWYLAITVVLPPFYALAAPVPLLIYKLWRQRGMVVYRRVFSNATISLAYGAASWLFHRLPAAAAGTAPGTGVHVLAWTAVVAGCGALAWAVNVALILVAMRLVDPATRIRDLFGSREGLVSDLIELTFGASLALVVAINPVLMALALPSVVLYRRYLMQAQLVAQARMDSKTGLLNAGTWHREAEVEFFRALRTRAPLAVIMIDIDHFRSVNETAGIAAGDQVLRDIARTVVEKVYGQGLVGRLSGEEFAILLPGTGLEGARLLAERLRDHIAAEPIAIEGGGHAGFVFRLTVSIGIAVLSQPRCAFADLLGAAGAALAEAKRSGRNRVCADGGGQASAA